MAGFNIEFGRNFERDLSRAVQGAVKDVATEYQRMLDSLLQRYSGRPLAEIRPVLEREWRRIGGRISDPELTEYASHISSGTRIVMRPGR
jgi:hypothetical protein